jgi:hypothetical protein
MRGVRYHGLANTLGLSSLVLFGAGALGLAGLGLGRRGR